ncbi:uncharacterized protein LOC114522223 [Dendronephthya gigantea]|uniref:uncharacterized protein LOC114522223 n=1 Tax=Dendronephthya gigantea TaxID=151771 RepID=UPI00106D79A6|nr:uncharacterized protein LOC114522223 [Dendronephthya gigantea]
MKIFIITWCVLFTLRLTESHKCSSRYFSLLRGRRLKSSYVERIKVESPIMCAMKCMKTEWCQATNFISDTGKFICELFNATKVGSGQIINDESAVYYFSLAVEEGASKTHEVVTVTPTPTAHVLTLIPSSIVLIQASSTVPYPMTSSATAHTTPAVACKKIFQDNPGSSDGQHTVFPGTNKEAQVFCDMTGALTGCGGGGWTLVMRIDGQKQTFAYDASYWTNKQEYQSDKGNVLDDNSETKLSTYHTTPFTQICLGMKYNNQKGWTTLSLTSSSLFDLVSSNTYHQTTMAVTQWKKLIPSGAALQPNCRMQGINTQRGGTGVRIGIIATKTCGVDGDYNSRLGFGGKGTSCGQDGNNRCGYDARCVNGGTSKKTTGYILVR